MYRTISEELKRWKDSPRRKPLLFTGVRQCGKTYILKQFGEDEFENMLYVNFEESSNYTAVFDYDFDPERIITELERLTKTKVTPGRTLLCFDEIQECPRAITSLKYFCENKKDLHLVCAGSLLGVALRQENISFPVGKVNRMQLFPMSFTEFASACGETDLLATFKDWPLDRPVRQIYEKLHHRNGEAFFESAQVHKETCFLPPRSL